MNRRRPLIDKLEARRLLSGNITTLATLPGSGTALGGLVVQDLPQGTAAAAENIFGVTQASSAATTTTSTTTASTAASLYEWSSLTGKITTLSGTAPEANLTIDSAGDVFGDISTGEIFKIPAGTQTVESLATYTSTTGGDLGDGVVRDLAGDIFVLAEAGTSTTTTTTTTTTSGDAAILEYPASSAAGFSGRSTPGAPSTSSGSSSSSDEPISLVTRATFPSGISPTGQLAIDAAGDIFAVAPAAGASSVGAIYELRAGSSSINQIASFGTSDPTPQGDLIADAQGDIFGTTYDAVTTQQSLSTVFELAHGSSSIKSLDTDSSFAGSHFAPGVARDSYGDLFGVIDQTGGASTIFEISAGKSARTIASASEIQSSGNNVNEINGYLAIDADGKIYGTTTAGDGHSPDTLFAVSSATVLDAATGIAITAQPSSAAVATKLSPITVAAFDSNGNIVPIDDSPVTVAISGSGAGVLTGTNTVTPIDGIATFDDLEISATGTYRLIFSSGASQIESDSITIASSTSTGPVTTPTTQLLITAPATAVAGSKTSRIQVTAETTSGAIAPQTRGKVTLTIAAPSSSADSGLAAPIYTASVALKKGIATFSKIGIDQAGSYEISAQSGALASSASPTLLITPAATRHLSFSEPPDLTLFAGGNFSVQLTLSDAFGNTAIDSSAITLALAGGSRSPLLGGTLTADASAGVATFPDLSITKPGLYSLIAIDTTDHLRATCTAFRVVASSLTPGGS